MNVRVALFSAVIVAALASLVVFDRTGAQDEPNGHPIVGSWILEFPDSPDSPPSFYTFSADGTVVGTSAAGGRHGAWELDDDGQTVVFTVAGLADFGLGSGFVVIEIFGEVTVDPDANTLVIEYIVRTQDAELAPVVASGPFIANGKRITVERFDAGTPEVSPTPGDEVNATPVV